MGPWTPWGQCLPSGVQARSQACEYGRKIQRRGCPARNYYAQMQQQQVDAQYQQQQQQYFSQQQQHQQEAQERQRIIDQQRQQQQYEPQQIQPLQQQQPAPQQQQPPRPSEPVSYPPRGYQDDYNRQREEMERKREEHLREYQRRQEEYNRLVEERRRLESERTQQQQPQGPQVRPPPPSPPQYPPPQQLYPSNGQEELHPAIPASQAAQCPNENCAPTRPPPPPAPACRSAACIPTRPPLGVWQEWSDWLVVPSLRFSNGFFPGRDVAAPAVMASNNAVVFVPQTTAAPAKLSKLHHATWDPAKRGPNGECLPHFKFIQK